MSVFPMCPHCLAEYQDPRNRRFHAQPNARRNCGPQLEFCDSRGQPLSIENPIAEAIARLRAGDIVAVKGLGGFHLAVDATNAAAVGRLRERKRRVEKPFAVMVSDLETVSRFCMLDAEERKLLCLPQRPVVLAAEDEPMFPGGQRGSFQPILGNLPPIHAHSSFTFQRERTPSAGNDQRQLKRRADRHRELRGGCETRGHRRLVSASQSRNSSSVR